MKPAMLGPNAAPDMVNTPGQPRHRCKGNQPEALTGDQRQHHDNAAHGQAKGQSSQIQYDDMLEVSQREHRDALNQKTHHDDISFIAAVHKGTQPQTADNTGYRR